jgi:glucan phosphorylase
MKKQKLCEWVCSTQKVGLSVDSFFNVPVKRIHECNRQLLNILRVVHL